MHNTPGQDQFQWLTRQIALKRHLLLNVNQSLILPISRVYMRWIMITVIDRYMNSEELADFRHGLTPFYLYFTSVPVRLQGMYRFIFSRQNYYALLGPQDAAREIMTELSDYMGPVFEAICQKYLMRQARLHALPFIPQTIGKWWGNNPAIKAQDDVDILAIDRSGTEAIFCECKYQNRPMPMAEYDDLMQAAAAFPQITKRHFLFFSKSGYTQPVQERTAREGTRLLTIPDLYQK